MTTTQINHNERHQHVLRDSRIQDVSPRKGGWAVTVDSMDTMIDIENEYRIATTFGTATKTGQYRFGIAR